VAEDQPLSDAQRKTEPARRQRRYKAARERIRKIVDGAPPLTSAQLADLAALLCPDNVREVA
jgi:hypothetical protein